MLDLQLGDVVVIRSQGLVPRLIRLFEAFSDAPNSRNHVAVVHHHDAAGTLWGIEARPGGVGWVDMKPYASDRWTLSNVAQPKTVEQRSQICAVVESMLQRPYDYGAIAIDAANALGLPSLWMARDFYNDEVPAHVVCSALAAWVYARVGLAKPAGGRFVTPGDWDRFITEAGWA